LRANRTHISNEKNYHGVVCMPTRLSPIVAVSLLAACGGGGGGSEVERVLDELSETSWHQSAAVADMTGDGVPDIVTVSHIWETDEAYLNVFVQQPGGSFGPKIEVPLGRGTTRRVEDVIVGDIDLDGLADVVVAHLGRTTAGVIPGREISVLLKSGMGASDFSLYQSYDVADNPFRLAMADLDIDGLPDLAVAADGGVFVLLQDGSNPGEFLNARRIDDGRARDLAIGDVNQDGLPDVLAAGGFGVHLLVNEISELGTFSLGGSWATPTWPSDMTMSDLNGDGRLDFAIGLSESDNFDHAGIAFRLQDPLLDGEFGAETQIDFLEVRTLGSLDSQDLNGDGRADLVAGVSNGPEGVSVAVQAASHSGFGDPILYHSSQDSGPWMAIIGQLGPDLRHDVVLAHSLNGVFVHFGEGVGTFQNAVMIGE